MKSSENIISNKLTKYDKLIYKSRPVKFSDFIVDKYDDIHIQLYNAALNNLIKDICKENNILEEDFIKTHVFVEIKQNEFFLPSKVIVKEIIYPFTIKKYNLEKYWNNFINLDDHRNINKLMIDDDSLIDCEIIYIDYVKGKVKFRSKFTGVEFWKDFKYINSNTRYNKDETSLEKTFTYKLQNKIYGE